MMTNGKQELSAGASANPALGNMLCASAGRLMRCGLRVKGVGRRGWYGGPRVAVPGQRYRLQAREVVPRESGADLLYRLEWQPKPLEAPAAGAHTGDLLIIGMVQ
jgi:hypothetical protein